MNNKWKEIWNAKGTDCKISLSGKRSKFILSFCNAGGIIGDGIVFINNIILFKVSFNTAF